MAAEEESFVSIGSAFDVPDEDAPKKKSLPVHEQFATDSDGRRRFHGAFTGGFSAGYFNTVGSKEGWTPSTFVSSRAKRFESSRQKPEDFMDDEDLGEFGIAPRNVETTKLFSRESDAKEKRNNVPSTSGISLDSVMKYTLEDLVIPCRMSIGVRLLKKMGWKEGQGIGPRVRQIPKKKVYGCVFPPGTAGGKEDNEHDIYAEGLLFAPQDTTTIKFTPKDNLHGIGYKGMLAPAPAEMSRPGFSGNLKIKGQAFGVGAFEDDDEDVYTQDSMSNYDIELHDHKHSHSDLHGWTGPPGKAIEGGALSLFAKASKPKPANKVFPAPSIPKGYQPFIDVKETFDKKHDEQTAARHTSETRGTLLGEQPLQKTTKSVFDLMSKDDRERVASTKKTLQLNYPVGKIRQSSNVRAPGFQPFAKDPAKQARYENFLEYRKTGNESSAPSDLRCGLTEWEREREKEEFSRSAMLYQPLKGDIAARFTRGGNIDDDLVPDKYQSKSTVDESKSVEEKAAEMKMFGKLTRTTFEWRPAKLLCKRFNIPEPYPSSSGTGLVGEKKEKFTLAQLFETSQKDESVDTSLKGAANVPDSSTAVSGIQVTARNVNTEENTNLNPISGVIDTFEQKPSEKPPMDLFKAIFASSSEDESSKSDDEEFGIEQERQLPVETSKTNDASNNQVITSEETKIYHDERYKEIHNQDGGVHKHTSRDGTQANNENAKDIPRQSSAEQNTVEEEEEYGPRPPPLQTRRPEKSCDELEYRKTVPFSRYDSNSESDSDRPKRKHRRKQKHKTKHKNKDKDRERSKKRGDKVNKTNRDASCNSLKTNLGGETIGTLKQSVIPDDKQILSKLKAVQKRRMCAADFM